MRQATVYISDKNYFNFLELVKNLKYVEKIETDQENLNWENNINIDSYKPSQETIKILDKALKQDKNTFISRDNVNDKYNL